MQSILNAKLSCMSESQNVERGLTIFILTPFPTGGFPFEMGIFPKLCYNISADHSSVEQSNVQIEHIWYRCHIFRTRCAPTNVSIFQVSLVAIFSLIYGNISMCGRVFTCLLGKYGKQLLNWLTLISLRVDTWQVWMLSIISRSWRPSPVY